MVTYAHSVEASSVRRALGEVLRAHRERVARSLSTVAAEAGCSPAYLSEVERGLKDISSELLVAVTYALGVHPGEVHVEVGNRLLPAQPEQPAWPSDPRQQLRLVTAGLDQDAVRVVAQFGAFLAQGGEPERRRIGFMPRGVPS